MQRIKKICGVDFEKLWREIILSDHKIKIRSDLLKCLYERQLSLKTSSMKMIKLSEYY